MALQLGNFVCRPVGPWPELNGIIAGGRRDLHAGCFGSVVGVFGGGAAGVGAGVDTFFDEFARSDASDYGRQESDWVPPVERVQRFLDTREFTPNS